MFLRGEQTGVTISEDNRDSEMIQLAVFNQGKVEFKTLLRILYT